MIGRAFQRRRGLAGSRRVSSAASAAAARHPRRRRVRAHQLRDLRTACITVVWSRLPKRRPISGSDRDGQLLGQVHRDLARPGDGAGAAGDDMSVSADVVVLGDLALDLLDRHAAVVRAQQVVQHLLRVSSVMARPNRLACAIRRFSAPSSSRTFEVILWARNSSTLCGTSTPGAAALASQDAEAQLVGGGVDVGDHAAAQPRAQPVLDPVQVRGRLVGGDHDLLAGRPAR